jgi:hypothetical protein
MKIKLLRPLWNKKRNDIIEVPEPNGIWAVKKGFAEFIPEPINPIEAKVVTEYENKVIVPEYKKRGRKAK